MNPQITVCFHSGSMFAVSIQAFLVDLNALAWLEDYLQTWPGTLLVVYVSCYSSFLSVSLHGFIVLTIAHSCESHLKASSHIKLTGIRDAVATDIVHQHSGRLDYYKG